MKKLTFKYYLIVPILNPNLGEKFFICLPKIINLQLRL